MNLGDYFRWANSIVPEADETFLPSISTTQLCKRDILNEGAKEFVKLTKCFPREKRFNCAAGVYTYSISSNIPDFLEAREEGIWHYRSDSSTEVWDRLKPTTVRELDQEFSNWRTQANNDFVNRYWQDGDIFGFFYTPSTTRTNGFWAYYYGMSSDMSITTQYPFTGTTTQDPRLSAYENILLDYFKAKALDLLGYKDDGAANLRNFYNKCMVAKGQLELRRDLAQESKARVKTRMNFGNPFRR